MMPWPLAGRSLRRGAPPHLIRAGKQGSLGLKRWRLYLLRQDDTIDSTAHELVALARRRLEPRPVDLDQAPPIGPDSTRCAQLAYDMRHSRAAHAEQFRKRVLRQRQDLAVSPIVDLQQPSRQAGRHRMQRIAGCDMLELGH